MVVPVRENQVVINCGYREGGIGIMDMANFSLSGITMVKCGIKGADRGFFGDLYFPYFAVHISKGVNQ